MAEYASLIVELPLYTEMRRSAGRDGISEADVTRLQGLIVEVADTVGPVLKRIPITFHQYTEHDIHHSRNVIMRMSDIIPPATLAQLNAVELTFLILSALLHDVGMVVTDEEKEATLASSSFWRFCHESHGDRIKAVEDARSAGQKLRARVIEDALLAEYYRRLHPERIWQYIASDLAGKLRFREVDFTDYLGQLCESHAWGVEESNDPQHPEKAVNKLDYNVRLYNVRVNLQYLACCLRLGDILDFDRSRTPLAVFQQLDFTETLSWQEWNKHLQVDGFEITSTQIAFNIPCTLPVFYIAVHEFLDWIDLELRQCRYLTENKQYETAERYKFLIPQAVDRHRVRMKDPSYVAGAFQFQLEYEELMRLLMDKSLYPDPSLFLRELLQNSLDACRRKQSAAKLSGSFDAYKPHIVVWDRQHDAAPHIIFQDNGVGMSERVVKSYFLRVGRSYYRSSEFDAERKRLEEAGIELDACSNFGIGILSCFLVAERLEVETYQEGFAPLSISINGPTKHFVVRHIKPRPAESGRGELEGCIQGPPIVSGTKITLFLKSGANTLSVENTLRKFAVNIDFPISVYSRDSGRQGEGAADGCFLIEPYLWEKAGGFSRADSGIPVNVESIMISHHLPLSSWSFSRHLRGSAWFWFLKGINGESCLRTGFLELDRYSIKPVEFPDHAWKIFQMIPSFCRPDSSVKLSSLFELMENGIENGYVLEDPSKGTAGYEVNAHWRAMKSHERVMLLTALKGMDLPLGKPFDRFKPWYGVEGWPEMFRNGSYEWLKEWSRMSGRIDIGASIDAPSGNFELAINSIYIPMGIIEWSLYEGSLGKVPLGVPGGGCLIDVRGVLAPVPATHRLFVPRDGAVKIALPLYRAIVRHGADLVAEHGGDLVWREWFEGLLPVLENGLRRVTDIPWETFKTADKRYVRERCKYECIVNKKKMLLSAREIEDYFGFSINISKGSNFDGFRNSSLNRFMIGAELKVLDESLHINAL